MRRIRHLLPLVLLATCAVAAAGERFVPVVAQVKGMDDSYWNTELWVTNLSAGTGTYAITFLPAGQDNTRALLTAAPATSLGPGETVHVRDVVPPGETGALRVVTTDGVVVTCRLYNARSRGSVGQIIPALAAGEMVAAGQRAFLVPLLRSSQFRTNLGLFNPTQNPIKVQVTLLNGRGREVGRAEYAVEPGSQVQVNDVLLAFRVNQADGFQAMLVGDGRFAAYASIVDTRSNAPTTLMPVFE